MKKMLLAIGLLCFAITLKAQTVNDIPLKDIDVDYVQIVGTSKLLSTQLTIELDFGQRNKFFSFKDTQVKDETGKLLSFNSMIDALNFMSANGYEFVSAYTISVQNQNVYHYLLKKKK
jgi:spore germination protein YaaH